MAVVAVVAHADPTLPEPPSLEGGRRLARLKQLPLPPEDDPAKEPQHVGLCGVTVVLHRERGRDVVRLTTIVASAPGGPSGPETQPAGPSMSMRRRTGINAMLDKVKQSAPEPLPHLELPWLALEHRDSQ